MIYYEIIYAIVCVIFAKINANWIAEEKRIKHGWNGLFHLVVSGIGGLIWGWLWVFPLLLIARVSFDWSLNLFRGKGLDYVSPNPKSIADKIEKRLFSKSGLWPKLIYIILIIFFNVFL